MSQPTDTPIQTDVVAGEEVEDVTLAPEVKTDRETMMNSIVAKRNEEVEADILMDAPDEDLDLSKEIDDKTIIADEVIAEDEPEKIAVKIDGVEEEVTPDQIRDYQVNRAADVRIREAAEETKRLNEREVEIDRREAALAKPLEVKVVPAETAEALAKRLVKSTFDEDEAGAAEVIQEIMSSNQPAVEVQKPLSQADINTGVTEALRLRDQKKAITRFDSDYPFLAANMRSSVNERSIIERDNDPDASIWDIIKRSAEHVKTEVAKEFGAKAPEEVKPEIIPDLEARRKLKEDTGNTVKTSAAAKAAIPDPNKVKPHTPQQSFLEIQRSRGQG